MKESFGKMLKRLRKEKNLTLKELGQMAKISFVEIHNLENEKCKPSAPTVARLSKALKCEDLFDTLN